MPKKEPKKELSNLKDGDLWKSKKYTLRHYGKIAFYAQFFLKLKNGARYLYLWVKDIYEPGQPCYYLRVTLPDFTTYLVRRLRNKETWTSKPYMLNRKWNPIVPARFYLKYKRGRNGLVPVLIFSLKDTRVPGSPLYITRLSVSDFLKLNKLVNHIGRRPYYR